MDDTRSRASPRLQFTKEELENPALERPIAKAEKAAKKAEKAKAACPAQAEADHGGSRDRRTDHPC